MSAKKPRKSLMKMMMGIPPEENLVWGMIRKQGNPIHQVLAFLAFLFGLWFAYQSFEAALAFVVAIVLHEFGHWFIFQLNDIKAKVYLLFPLGAVAAPVTKEEDDRSDLLPWWNIAWMLLAGPTINFVQMVAGLAMIHFGIFPSFGYELVLINGMLGAFNLLPLINMDGGQFFHVIYSSLKEEYDFLVAIVGLLITAAIVVIIYFSPLGQGALIILGIPAMKSVWVIFFGLMGAGIWHKQGKDNPLHSKSGQAMTPKQAVIQLTYYVLLVAGILFLMTI